MEERGDSRLLDESVSPLFEELVKNCSKSGNLGTLISVFLARGVELKESARCENSLFVWHAHNALFIVRVITKLLLEHYSEEDTLQRLSFQLPESSIPTSISGSADPVEQLLWRTVYTMTELPLTPATTALQLEALTALQVFLSAQLVQRPAAHETNKFFRILHESCNDKEKIQLIKTLLQWIIQRPPPSPDPDSSGSFVAGLAAGLWSVLTLGLASSNTADTAEADADYPMVAKPVPPSPLADQSVLLLLVLATHTPHNRFREVLFSCSDVRGMGSGGELCVPYSELYVALTLTLHSEQTTLLLYMLLHNCHHFRLYVLPQYQYTVHSTSTDCTCCPSTSILYTVSLQTVRVAPVPVYCTQCPYRLYVLSRSDLELVVLPLLQALYLACKLSSHHVYMALIVLLMLSEDTTFNAALHDIVSGGLLDVVSGGLLHIPAGSVTWFTERPLSNMSLGDLLILVLIRTITFNMTKMR
ncbi:hypothetical protein FHG87_023924, partial [Trinorchestia longiramus]